MIVAERSAPAPLARSCEAPRLLEARAAGDGAEIRAVVARQIDAVTDRAFARAALTRSFYDAFLVEWDEPERAGDHSALRHVPEGRIAALDVVSSKHPPVEAREQLVHQIERATPA